MLYSDQDTLKSLWNDWTTRQKEWSWLVQDIRKAWHNLFRLWNTTKTTSTDIASCSSRHWKRNYFLSMKGWSYSAMTIDCDFTWKSNDTIWNLSKTQYVTTSNHKQASLFQIRICLCFRIYAKKGDELYSQYVSQSIRRPKTWFFNPHSHHERKDIQTEIHRCNNISCNTRNTSLNTATPILNWQGFWFQYGCHYRRRGIDHDNRSAFIS